MESRLSRDDPEEWVRQVMSDARPPSAWLQLLTSADADDQHRAKYKLGSLMPEDRAFFSYLIVGADSFDERVRFMSLVGLNRLEHFPPELLTLVTAALRDPVQAIRQAALSIAPKLDSFDLDLTLTVAGLLRSDPERFVRSDAASAAGRLVARGANLLPDLLAVTHDEDRFVRTRAVIAVKLLGPLATAAAERMAEVASRDTDEGIRVQASAALRAMRRQPASPPSRTRLEP